MAKKMKIDPLPDTMSGLIRVALRDLKKAERTPKYKINMDEWHRPSDNGKSCSVCYAGSVMAFSLNAGPLASVEPSNWWNGIAQKLEVINYLRCGGVSTAARVLRVSDQKQQAANTFEIDNEPLCTAIPEYSKRTRVAFHAAQKKLADALARVGL